MKSLATNRKTDWGRTGTFLALTAYLLFAHGCHGDEDHELFASRLAFSTSGKIDQGVVGAGVQPQVDKGEVP